MRFTTAVLSTLGCIFLLAFIIIAFTSVTRVDDNEVCELHYPDDVRKGESATVEVATSPGMRWVGPGYEKKCITQSTQHITFTHESEGLGQEVSISSIEGVPIALEIDIEFKIVTDRFSDTVRRTGFDPTNSRLMREARAQIRDVASQYTVEAFLVGTRENISIAIQTALARRLLQDRVYITIIKVNLLHIVVDPVYEALFQQVENIRLQQIVASELPNIIRINETRLNETQIIARQAVRNQEIQIALTATTNAQLAQTRRVTEADTAFQQAMIVAESARNVEMIEARTELGRIVASRQVRVDEIVRQALANKTVSETDRQNMVVQAVGNQTRAAATRTRDLALATIDRTQRLEELVSREITHALALFEIDLDTNTSEFEILSDSAATAAETLGRERAVATDWVTLRTALCITDRQLAEIVLYRAFSRSTDMLVTVDHVSGPLQLIEGGVPGGVLPSVAVAAAA
jgi:hypothetical protein